MSRRRSLRTGIPRASLAVLLGFLVACSAPADPSGEAAGALPTPAPPASSTPAEPADPLVYVAVGASETLGVGADDPATQAWPRVLQDRALPGSRLVNVGVSGATVAGALTAQVPAAVAADPDVVTVWLAVNDAITQVPVTAYERRLARLVATLRRGGAEVLVGNVPRLWRLPAYRACLPRSQVTSPPCVLPFVPTEAAVRATVRAYNAAIERVVAAQGARLVDLSGEVAAGRLVAADGFHPSTAGHARIAAAFARAVREVAGS